MQQFILRDVPDKCSIGAKCLQEPSIYRLFYLLTAQVSCLYASSKTLALKWKPHGIQLCYPLFITGMDTQRPGQLLLTYSALHLAVEHMPEYTDNEK